MNDKNTQLTLQDEIGYFEGDPCFEKSKAYVEELLHNLKIDITDDKLKFFDVYKDIKDISIFVGKEHPLMSLEEFIERFLIVKEEIEKYYITPFEMGCRETIPADRLNDDELIDEIYYCFCGLRTISGEESTDKKCCTGWIEDKDEVKSNIKNYFFRKGGLIDRLNNKLKFNLNKFDKDNLIYRQEYYKILYFFYWVEKVKFPDKRVLQLLSNPSMENIDNSFWDEFTHNGYIIKTLKETLGKELSLERKSYIYSTLANISIKMDEILYVAEDLMNKSYALGINCESIELIPKCLDISQLKNENTNKSNELSPIEELYLIISKLEYLYMLNDTKKVNMINNENNLKEVPADLIPEMIELEKNDVTIENIEEYIYNEAPRLNKYVYFNEYNNDTSDKEKDKKKKNTARIRKSAKAIRKLLEFCAISNPKFDKSKPINEFLLVSMLQAKLIDDQRELFEDSYHGYENKGYYEGNSTNNKGRRKGKKSVQGALKNDGYVSHVLRHYWVVKIKNHWYANMEANDLREKNKKFEIDCDNLAIEIFNLSSINSMKKAYQEYYKYANEILQIIKNKIYGVFSIREFLYSKNFEYIDDKCMLQHPFADMKYLSYDCNIIACIDNAIKNKKEIGKIYSKDKFGNPVPIGEGKDGFSLEFSFDYTKNICKLTRFEGFGKSYTA